MSHHSAGIITKYLGPTYRRPARVTARSTFHRVTIAWDHALGVRDNHIAAARALSYKMGLGRPSVERGPDWEFLAATSPDGIGYMVIMVDAPSVVHGWDQ